ncbi:hypothetical protein ALP26_02650 [Pseudomonas savastanoi pv. glycinea]|uniref:Uncharacterized protein n=2 Tax=Pseudomonas savastanoi pv. glycinea TaxID=318 RepID=A0A3M3IX80_PSESG|nr:MULTISPECIES: hypothetical protein [Pseudomonas]EFW83023.1 hypothetical protein PsgRace4_26810 [Pseudomonas savastanoi pv. glycinea str. race 4]EGH16885.1 hypothetical protein Pgy4_28025 [Pseudomonas savastanoi pv. glycinea str. race 4]MCQ3008368.1 hypothetical protein [Pseudomonas savastanoi]MCT8952271.1 hypothetical protein [Pseudomonas lundensis]RML94122.1 hypothetical protein ALQ87_01049 [Pseudomonas savastanoi pv. glycinea]
MTDIGEIKNSSASMKHRIRQLGELIQEMENILGEGAEDAPLAFFEVCEEAQLQVMQLMRATFLAVQVKPN